MSNYICTTCGTQFADSAREPGRCPVCEDERQFVNWAGQQWTTLEQLRRRHRVTIKPESELTGVGVEPSFAIGQRALLLRRPAGNILWDCLSLIDDGALRAIEAFGGIALIAISHPHYYASMVEWSHAFGNVPIYLHAADRRWVMRPDPAVIFWDGERSSLGEDATLVRCGGHFSGGTVLHWAGGSGGKGVLLAGDILQVVPDRRYVSFMYSYPNLIPLSASAIRRIAQSIEPFAFEQIYGAWWDRNVLSDAKAAVARSVERYLRAVGE